jgi:hypothetical protein
MLDQSKHMSPDCFCPCSRRLAQGWSEQNSIIETKYGGYMFPSIARHFSTTEPTSHPDLNALMDESGPADAASTRVTDPMREIENIVKHTVAASHLSVSDCSLAPPCRLSSRHPRRSDEFGSRADRQFANSRLREFHELCDDECGLRCGLSF